MTMALAVILFILGIILIVKGGDFFVDAAAWFAEISGIPKLIVGATLVSVATTLPEMLVSMIAAADGSVEMSIGNAVGSVTANIGLIMAISILAIPAIIKRSDYMMKSILMLSAAGLIVICGFIGEVAIPVSIALLAIFGFFMYENIHSALKARKEGAEDGGEKPEKPTKSIVILNILKFLFGAMGIVVGAQLLVDKGEYIALELGVDERIIGVTVIAVGTSLPELVTTITAILKKQSSLSVGNIIGANIMDLSLILPMSSLVAGKPLPVKEGAAAYIDLPACLLVGIIALLPALFFKRFRRWQGVVLLAVYTAFVVLTCVI